MIHFVTDVHNVLCFVSDVVVNSQSNSGDVGLQRDISVVSVSILK